MGEAVTIGPVAKRDRIEVIDVLRGVAILGILHLNMPLAVNPAYEIFTDPRSIGWSGADQLWWSFQEVFTSGTMRGMLQLLFGAGLMLLAAKAMTPTGPVGVADVWYRRNLWLMVFGAFNGILLLWPGDILFPYALAAIFIFPFRLLKARWLFAIGAAFMAWTVNVGVSDYREDAAFVATVNEARTAQTAGGELTEDQNKALVEWDRRVEAQGGNPTFAKTTARMIEAQQDPASYIRVFSVEWFQLWKFGQIQEWVYYSFFVMLIGMALFKIGFIQGSATTSTYALVMVAGYVFGFGARYWGLQSTLTFEPYPDPADLFGDTPRLAISIAHIAAINLLMRSRGAAILSATLGATGRIAFTIYLMQSFIITWILAAPWGLDLYNTVSWIEIAGLSAIVMALQVLFAMWWLKRFRFGPLEWIWRSLTHWKTQRMRVTSEEDDLLGFGPQSTGS